jgi:hypothetical protein
MLLLKIEDNGDVSLVEYMDERKIPLYAILSHRWGTDIEEVTFQEIQQKTGTTKTRRDKIIACAGQVKEDDLRFIWIDTCCVRHVAQMTMTHESGGSCRQKRWA